MNFFKYLWIVFMILMLGLSLHAESFEEYMQSEMKAFNDYKDSLDKEFSDYLNQPWKSFDSLKSKPKLKPKPQVIEPIEVVKRVEVPGKKPVVKTVIDVPIVKQEVKVPVIEKIPEIVPIEVVVPKAVITPKTADARKNSVNFYGNVLEINYNNPLENSYATMINKDKMKQAWDAFATSEYVELVDQVQSTIKVLNLNDWGRIKLLEKIGEKVFRNKNEARLFTWFVFTKLKYDIKVGFTRKYVVLLTPINTMLYSTTYFTIGKKKYFAIDFSNSKINLSQIRTYEKSHPSAELDFDLRIDKSPRLKQREEKRTIDFNFNNKDYHVELMYDMIYVAYYKNYPQVAYPNYFQAPLSPLANASFHNDIAKLIEGKGEIEAVNLLLRLVQKGFKYQIDETQFNREKVMLPEETLYYPFSDCEDRAILFSKLASDLLGLEVVGIKFPAHLATAVALKSRLSGGTSFMKDGKRYYMADPTYMGADVGMMPPQYKNQKFEIIVTR